MSKQATCGSSGARSSSARIGARLCGWCSGASGTSFSSFATHARHRRAPARRSRCPPCTTRWPTADEPVRRAVRRAQSQSTRCASAPSWPSFVPVVPALLARPACPPRPSRRSAARCRCPRPGRAATSSSSPPRSANSENLMLDEPALRTSDRVGHALRRSPSPRSRAARCATSAATAHEASRVVTESARLVRMIGTLRAEHDAGRVGAGEERQALREHVAGLEVGHDQHVGAARDRRVDLLDRRRLEADRVVERERAVEDAAGDLAAVGHLAQRRRLDRRRHLRVDRLHRRQDRDPHLRRRRSACARSIAFCTMSTLSSSVGAMLTAASVMISASAMRRHVHHEAVADAPRGAQPGVALRPPRPSARRCGGCPSSAPRPCPARTSSTAFAAAAWLCGASTIS